MQDDYFSIVWKTLIEETQKKLLKMVGKIT